jgi:hypothetical protein
MDVSDLLSTFLAKPELNRHDAVSTTRARKRLPIAMKRSRFCDPRFELYQPNSLDNSQATAVWI